MTNKTPKTNKLVKDSLEEFYDLGYEHGYQMAKMDMEIVQLNKDIEEMSSK
jgi:hypothetical protein